MAILKNDEAKLKKPEENTPTLLLPYRWIFLCKNGLYFCKMFVVHSKFVYFHIYDLLHTLLFSRHTYGSMEYQFQPKWFHMLVSGVQLESFLWINYLVTNYTTIVINRLPPDCSILFFMDSCPLHCQHLISNKGSQLVDRIQSPILKKYQLIFSVCFPRI